MLGSFSHWRKNTLVVLFSFFIDHAEELESRSGFPRTENQTMRILRPSVEGRGAMTTLPTFQPSPALNSITDPHMITPKSPRPKGRIGRSEERYRRSNNPGSSSEDVLEPMQLPSASRIVGPYFESNRTSISVSARAGATVMFDCPVALLQGRTVRGYDRRVENEMAYFTLLDSSDPHKLYFCLRESSLRCLLSPSLVPTFSLLKRVI